MLPALVAFAKAAAPFVMPAVVGSINQRNENKAAMDAYNAQRAAEKEDQANKFTDMAAAARRAGFNPLTVLRATGGAGFGGTSAVMPVMSKKNFALQMASDAFTNFWDKQKVEKPIEKVKKSVAPKMTPIVTSPHIETERYVGTVSPKNWAGLNKDVQKQLRNAENIDAQAKIDGAVDTVAKFKLGGVEFEGSGLFGAMPSYEETLGDFGSVVMAPVLAVDAIAHTSRQNAQNRSVGWPQKTGRTVQTQQNYKVHRNDILIGVLPPLSKRLFTTGGVTTEGYAQ